MDAQTGARCPSRGAWTGRRGGGDCGARVAGADGGARVGVCGAAVVVEADGEQVLEGLGEMLKVENCSVRPILMIINY